MKRAPSEKGEQLLLHPFWSPTKLALAVSLMGRGGVQWVTVVLMLEQEVTGAKEDLGVAPNLNFPHLHKTQIYIKLNPNKLTSTSSVAAAV